MAAGRTEMFRVKWDEELDQLEYDYHVRTFGEEMARINFLPLEQRRREIWEIREYARSKGVPEEKPARGVT